MSDWAGEHSELFLIHRTDLAGFTDEGLSTGMRYYEDCFADRVRRTVVNYGSDGIHAPVSSAHQNAFRF